MQSPVEDHKRFCFSLAELDSPLASLLLLLFSFPLLVLITAMLYRTLQLGQTACSTETVRSFQHAYTHAPGGTQVGVNGYVKFMDGYINSNFLCFCVLGSYASKNHASFECSTIQIYNSFFFDSRQSTSNNMPAFISHQIGFCGW